MTKILKSLTAVVIVIILSLSAGCTKDKTQAVEIFLDYPNQFPLYQISWQVCGEIVGSENGCIDNSKKARLLLWGPIEGAKLIVSSVPNTVFKSSINYQIFISSKGCFPKYMLPQTQQYYSANALFIGPKEEQKLSLNITTRLLNSREVKNLLKFFLSQSSQELKTTSQFVELGQCEPLSKNTTVISKN